MTLVVANNYNDSISVIDTATRAVRYEHDLRPFFASNEGTRRRAGGTFPFAVVVKGNDTAYVSSDRDREVVAIDVSSPTAGRLIKRIKLDGNALGMTLNESQSRLYVAQDNADQVAVIDTSSNRVVAKIDARAPEGMLPTGVHGRGDVCRDALPRWRHAVCGQQRLELHRRHPVEGPESARSSAGSFRPLTSRTTSRSVPTASGCTSSTARVVTGPNPARLSFNTSAA